MTHPRLSNATLALAAGSIKRPGYDRAELKTGIVHLGVGAFHRAHQALYTEAVLERGDVQWGTIGASLRSPDTHDALHPQNGLYTVAIRDASGDRLQIVGGMQALLVAPDDPQALLRAMADRDVRIVSLTITEKGYCHDPATGSLRQDHADIMHDLGHRLVPKSALGFIVEAIAMRRDAGHAPFTVMSCDNLPENGRTLKRLLIEFAALREAQSSAVETSLASYIDQSIPCPSTMIDRIVPATTDADRLAVAAAIGLKDAWPVMTEPFTQWVIEDRFASGRPNWSIAGAQFVSDARPYETMKLRLLNGAHSSIAYLGFLAGFGTVANAMTEPSIARHIETMMREEIAPTLTMPPDADLNGYVSALLKRFANPALHHRTAQIAMDGSQKLPQRLLNTIRDRLAAGQPFDRLALGVAAWMRYVTAIDEKGGVIDVRDPLAAEFRQLAIANADWPDSYARAMIAVQAVFGTDLAKDVTFVGVIETQYRRLLRLGALNVLRER